MIGLLLERPIAYVLSTVPVLWRGVWIDEFIVISLPALIWLLFLAIRSKELHAWAALSPGVFSLVFYALVSLNIPRYQVTAIPALAIAFGIGIASGVRSWRSQRAAKTIPAS
jgi:predicted membrane-bound mannosyltransferase